MKSIAAAMALLFLLPAAAAYGEGVRMVKSAKLDLSYHRESSDEPHVLTATVTNKSDMTIAFISHNDFLARNGWRLSITGPGGDFANPPPPGAIVFLEPEHCIVLEPGKSYTKRYCIASALCRSKERSQCSNLASTPGKYAASLSYTFDPSMLDAGKNPLPGTDDTRAKWQKLLNKAYFVESMSSPQLRFSVEKK